MKDILQKKRTWAHHAHHCIVAVLVLLAGGSSTLSAEEVIRLGFIGPLTTIHSPLGNDERHAIELALEDIQEKNLLPGKRFEVLFEDGKCSGKAATSAARKLINIDQVSIILGGVCSGETLALAPIAQANEVLVYSVFSSHPDITHAGDFIFRSIPSDKEGGYKAAEVIQSNGHHKIALLTDETEYALGLEEAFLEVFEKRPGNETCVQHLNPEGADVRTAILQAKRCKPDAIFLNPQSPEQGGELLRRLREQQWDVPVYGTFVFSADAAHTSAGGVSQLNGLIFIDAPFVEGSPEARSFLERFQKRYPAPQSTAQVVLRYDSLLLLAQAIREVGPAPRSIRDYLLSLEKYEGLAFSYHFNEYGDGVGVPYAVKTVRDGKIHRYRRRHTTEEID